MGQVSNTDSFHLLIIHGASRHYFYRVQHIVDEFKKMTKFQLKCFSNLEEDEDPAVESALPVTT